MLLGHQLLMYELLLVHRHCRDARVRVLLHRWWSILCWGELRLHQGHLILHEQALALEILAWARLVVKLLCHNKGRFACFMLLTTVAD